MHAAVMLDSSFLAELLPGLYRIVGIRSYVIRFIGLFVFECLAPAMLVGVANPRPVRILVAPAKVQGVNPAQAL